MLKVTVLLILLLNFIDMASARDISSTLNCSAQYIWEDSSNTKDQEILPKIIEGPQILVKSKSGVLVAELSKYRVTVMPIADDIKFGNNLVSVIFTDKSIGDKKSRDVSDSNWESSVLLHSDRPFFSELRRVVRKDGRSDGFTISVECTPRSTDGLGMCSPGQ